MEQAIRTAAGMADAQAEEDTNPSRDVELGRTASRHSRIQRNTPSRASLPTSHRRSFSTIGRSRPNSAADGRMRNDGAGDDVEDADEEGEIPWGPQHPCFPHPNPHVPLSSPLYESTRIIRIQRDWMIHGDLAPAFSNVYPEILEGLVPEDRFRALITKVNTTLEAAYMPTSMRNMFDTVMGLLTGWVYDNLGLTAANHTLNKLETWIEGWNRDVGAPEGVTLISLKRTAYLTLDIQIPDPQISADGNSTLPGSRPSSRNTANRFRDDVEYGAYPVVPPIPAQYRN